MRGGAHREGRGAGFADGHVISEYGSPVACRGRERRETRQTLACDVQVRGMLVSRMVCFRGSDATNIKY